MGRRRLRFRCLASFLRRYDGEATEAGGADEAGECVHLPEAVQSKQQRQQLYLEISLCE